MSKIIILEGSMRKGNTSALAEAFQNGAKKNNDVEIISVKDYKVNGCLGCNTCFQRENGECFQKDDMSIIYEKLSKCNTLVIASPVYFYGISAQLKSIVDRLHTPMRNSFNIKKLALILVGGANLPNLFDPILMQYNMILDFFKLEDGGKLLISGVRNIGDITEKNLDMAYEMGLNI